MAIYRKIYFNWHQLLRDSDKDANGILLLTYALSVVYNDKISWDSKHLIKFLHLDYIPNKLFERGLIAVSNSGKIVNKYKCEEPQSYYCNPYFATSKCSINYKYAYIYALSQIKISERQNYISDVLIQENQWDNPLLQHKDNNLYFIPEIAMLQRSNKHRT